ncbi:MAG: zinc ribbon domain-containing protein [Thermodesulfatator sp.]|nr:MAG: zinc ribbon domain-containing protein [Thermodesulfatator sp.]
MPIYEYQCESCGNIVENWQRITDPPLEECESCGGKMKKLISQSSFHLKGSGWYVTDYAGSKKSASASEQKGTKDKSAKKEKKPASSSSEKSSS